MPLCNPVTISNVWHIFTGQSRYYSLLMLEGWATGLIFTKKSFTRKWSIKEIANDRKPTKTQWIWFLYLQILSSSTWNMQKILLLCLIKTLQDLPLYLHDILAEQLYVALKPPGNLMPNSFCSCWSNKAGVIRMPDRKADLTQSWFELVYITHKGWLLRKFNLSGILENEDNEEFYWNLSACINTILTSHAQNAQNTL